MMTPDKQGKRMFGFIIQAPEHMNELNPDATVVTSRRYRDEILHSLNNDEALRQIKLCLL